MPSLLIRIFRDDHLIEAIHHISNRRHRLIFQAPVEKNATTKWGGIHLDGELLFWSPALRVVSSTWHWYAASTIEQKQRPRRLTLSVAQKGPASRVWQASSLSSCVAKSQSLCSANNCFSTTCGCRNAMHNGQCTYLCVYIRLCTVYNIVIYIYICMMICYTNWIKLKLYYFISYHIISYYIIYNIYIYIIFILYICKYMNYMNMCICIYIVLHSITVYICMCTYIYI